MMRRIVVAVLAVSLIAVPAWARSSLSESKTSLGLGNVENTALSTWAGTSNITTLGTIATGTWNATDIAVADGGTGASTALNARTNLGLAIGTNVQAWDADLDTLSADFTGAKPTEAAVLAFREATNNGTNFISLAGVANVAANQTLTLPDATDTLVGKATTDELTNKTLNASVGKGTWTASGTWTLPAFTLGGAVSGGAQTITTTGAVQTGALTATTGTFSNIVKSTHSYTTNGGLVDWPFYSVAANPGYAIRNTGSSTGWVWQAGSTGGMNWGTQPESASSPTILMSVDVNGNFSLTTTASMTAGTIELGHATDTTLARSGAGDVTIEGNVLYRAAGTDVSLLDGGTNASLTASNGGIFYSTATAGAILAGTATAGQMLRSGATAAPTWSTATFPATATATGSVIRADGTNWAATTATYPATTTVNQLLYSSATNTVGGLATANNGILITSGTGVPSILASSANGQIPIASGAGPAAWATVTGTANQVTVTNGANSITLATPQDIHTAATPTFGGITAASHTGGTAASSTLTLKSTSGAGTTDAIVFQVGNNGGTEAGRFLNSGYFGLGTTSPGAALVVSGATTTAAKVVSTILTSTEAIALGEVATDGSTPFYIQRYNSSHATSPNAVEIWNANNGFMRFGTNGAERARFTAGGGLHVGTTTSTGFYVHQIAGTFTSDGADSVVAGLNIKPAITGASGDISWQTTLAAGGSSGSSITTQAVAETISVVSTAYLSEPNITLGAGSAVTTGATLYIANAPTEATNNYGLSVAAGATYFGGNVGVNQVTATSPLHTTGFAVAVAAKTGAYTATAADCVISGDATSASFTITLPTAVGITGRIYQIKKINSANTVTIDGNGAETIDGATTKDLTTQWSSYTLVSDGANWLVL